MQTLVYMIMPGAVLAYAMLGGVFLAFSDFIMRALARTSGSGGIEAMQEINREVYRWVFMTLFLVMAAGSVALILYAVLAVPGLGGMLVLLSGLVYILGCFAVTAAMNVPMNTALAKMDHKTAEAAHYWQETYLPRWTFWNTLRAMACAVSAGLLLAALLVLSGLEG